MRRSRRGSRQDVSSLGMSTWSELELFLDLGREAIFVDHV